MIFTFNFGYHDPDYWPAFKKDHTFDCESTGSICIDASDEQAAREWGLKIAEWYIARLHGTQSDYKWKEEHYATWVSDDQPDQENIPTVNLGEYPDFELLRQFLVD